MARARPVLRALALVAACGFVACPASAAEERIATDCPPLPAPDTPEQVAAGMRGATDNGFLWKITRDGHSSWLFGTIHIARADWRFPGPREQAAIKASDTVALELDPTDPDIAGRLQRLVMRPAGAPDLPPALEARLRRQVLAACVDPALLAPLRPEMRAITIEVMAGRRLGLEPAYGVDIFLAQYAHELKKTVRSLETPELQASLLVSDDPRDTARTVGEVLDELEAGRGPVVLARLAGDWHDGKLADLSAYREWCECLDTPEQRADFARLIDERNPVMAEHIAAWHAEGHSLFVAVGSLHMVGDIGLPALLRARGFEVERIGDGQR